MPFIGVGGSQSYEINKSLRFRSSASARLSRTNAAAGNDDAWTWSAWVKRGQLNSAGSFVLFAATISAGASEESIQLFNDTLRWGDGASGENYATSAVFRDPSAWYHCVVAYDSNNATAGDRVKIYVNGVRQTTTGTNSALGRNSYFAINGRTIAMGRFAQVASTYFDGYMSAVHFIDGQALTPASFGQTDNSTGAWAPKKYTGAYGTNGFYLGFTDGTSLTTLGNDESGNNNDWTLNNISITSGVTYDWMNDTPTNNFPVLNAVASAVAPVAANMQMNTSNANYSGICSMGIPAGKWYWECSQNSGTAFMMAGITRASVPNGTAFWSLTGSYAYYLNTGQKYSNGSPAAYASAGAVGDVIGVAFDSSAGTLEFFKNNVSLGVAFTGLTQGDYFPAFGNGSGVAHTLSVNFGQQPFYYTPPTGYKALCTKNLPTPTVKRGDTYFESKTRAGTGATYSVSGLRFQPDLLWLKNRSASAAPPVIDAVRGGQNVLNTSLTNAESDVSPLVATFNSDGYSYNATGSGSNAAGNNYIDWMWKEAPGFLDIVTYTGNGANRTIAHNLGVAPKLIIAKRRSAVADWCVYAQPAGAGNRLLLSTTAASAADATMWNSTAPTSSVFSLGTNVGVNANADTYVAYLFAEVEGFSKIGSYTGNGSADGPFIWCGFRPRWILIKRTDSTENWYVYDTARDTYNVTGARLYANLSNAELGSQPDLDLLSNGLKIRRNDTPFNASGGTYVFMAFAETPFKYANAR